MPPKYQFLKRALAFITIGLSVTFCFGTDLGVDTQGKMPLENAIHLKRIQGPGLTRKSDLFQNSINLKPGGDYTLNFWARASDTFKLDVLTKLSVPGWGFFGLRGDVLLTPAWRRYTLDFKADGAVPEHTRLNFGFASVGEVWIADVQIRTAGSPDNASEHLIANARFIDELEQWNVDGKKAGVYEADVQPVSESSRPEKK